MLIISYSQPLVSLKKEVLHVLEVIEFTVTKAWWAVSIITVDAEIAVFVSSDHVLASIALAGDVLHVLSNHGLSTATAVSVFLDAFFLFADTESLLLSSEKDEFVGQVVDDIVAVSVKLFNIELIPKIFA